MDFIQLRLLEPIKFPYTNSIGLKLTHPEILMLPHWEALDNTRREAGYLTPTETMALLGKSNEVLDPFSLLISREVVIGSNNRFYPNVTISRSAGSPIDIGDGNIFRGPTLIEADGASVKIGDRNLFGEGGATIRANQAGASILIGNGCRLIHGATLYGDTRLGDGAQVLGHITAISCTLEAGGTFDEPEINQRAAVLKGMGTARGIHLARGQVIDGWGSFDANLAQPQSNFH